MPSATDAVIKQIDELLAEYRRLTGGASDAGIRLSGRPDAEVKALRMRLAVAVERLAPPKSAYVSEANGLKYSDAYAAEALSGILAALRADFQDGYMRTIEELVHAELFADFLDMADELVSKGYKDAAAVVAGSVLEEHLRKLAAVHGVSTRAGAGQKKPDTINADLVKAGAYNKLEQKNVTAWLGLRRCCARQLRRLRSEAGRRADPRRARLRESPSCLAKRKSSSRSGEAKRPRFYVRLDQIVLPAGGSLSLCARSSCQ